MRIKNLLQAYDHHHGQANRTVISGYPTIRGRTMREKEAHYLENMSWIHETMCREPRGHAAMLGSIITEPVSDDSEFGVLFLHANGLYDGCGDSTFGTAAAAIESGLVDAIEPVTRFSMDTVMGQLPVEVLIEDGVIQEVRYGNTPSYVLGSFDINVADHGKLTVNLGQCSGQYCPQIDVSGLDLSLDKSNQAGIKALGRQVTEKLLKIPPVTDPETGRKVQMGTNNANVIGFFARQGDADTYRIANTVSPDFMGRTPGGTPTGSLMAVQHLAGAYDAEGIFANTSPVGTTFRGTAKKITLPGGTAALQTTIGTKSWLMGINNFVIDPSDPFPTGFIL